MKNTVKNVEIVLKPTRDDKSDLYATYETARYDNNYNNNIHYHSFFELEFIVSGKGFYEINNVRYDAVKGALFLTTPADYHTYSLKEDESIEYYNVQFFLSHINDEIASRLYSYSVPIAINYGEEETEELKGKFRDLCRSFEEKSDMYEIEVRNLIENVCISIIRDMDKRDHGGDVHPMIKNAVIYVKNHYREEITLSKMAEYAGLSSAYFSHKFTEAVGMGFFSYLKQVRLNSAANLLKSTELSVKEVCYKTGFTDPNYFSNAFRGSFGMSPRDYRRKNKR